MTLQRHVHMLPDRCAEDDAFTLLVVLKEVSPAAGEAHTHWCSGDHHSIDGGPTHASTPSRMGWKDRPAEVAASPSDRVAPWRNSRVSLACSRMLCSHWRCRAGSERARN